jgi:hypothetical protein
MCAVVLALVGLSSIPSVLHALQAGVQGPKLDEILGPFLVDGQSYTVALHRSAIPPADPNDAGTGCSPATVVGMEIRNSSGVVEYQRSFPYKKCDSTDVNASVLKGAKHSGLLIRLSMSYVSCCVDPPYDTDNSYQLWGSIDGRLRAFNAPMTVVSLRNGNKNNPAQAEVVSLDADSDAWNLRVFANKFNVIYPVRIDWKQGKLSPLKPCSRQAHAFCEYAVEPISDFPDSLKPWPFVLHLCAEHVSPCGKEDDVKLLAKPLIKMLDSYARIDWSNDVPTYSAQALKNPSAGDVDSLPDAWQLGVYGHWTDPAEVWLKLDVNGHVGWLSDMNTLQNLGFPYEE